MGLIAIVRSAARELRNSVSRLVVKSDSAGNVTSSPISFQAAGDDATPLPSDAVFTDESQGNGRPVALGFVDVKLAGVTSPGEKRIYARDAGGALVASIHLQNNGEITITSTGTVVVNGAKIDSSGKIETSAGVDLDKLRADFDAHVHAVNSAPGVTDPPTIP